MYYMYVKDTLKKQESHSPFPELIIQGIIHIHIVI